MLDITVAVEMLFDAVEALKEEIRLLRDTIRDELGVTISWRDERPQPPPMHVKSISKDPLAKDFQINKHSAKDLPEELQPSKKKKQGELWD